MKFVELFDYHNKSHIKAGDGRTEGLYPFFTSSPVLSKYLDTFQFNDISLIFGTGGSASVHYCDHPFSVSTDCLVVGLKKEHASKFDVKYVYYYLSGNIRLLEDGFKGAGLRHISKSYINNIEIPVVSLEEQQRIVRVLDIAHSIIQKREEAYAMLDGYIKSLFVEMFGDPVKNTSGWDSVKLETLLKYLTSGSRGWAKYFSDDGDFFFTIKNVSRSNRLLLNNVTYVNAPNNAEAKRTKVEESDILMSITADLGRTAVVPKLNRDAYINQHLVILRLKENINPTYISHYLSTDGGQLQMKSLNKGAAKAGLNFNDIRSIDVLLPPIDLQNKYFEIVTNIESLRKKMQNQSLELNNQFRAINQMVFMKERA